jgi:hypothetical protein
MTESVENRLDKLEERLTELRDELWPVIRDMEGLDALIQNTSPLPGGAIELRNVRLYTNMKGAEAVLVLGSRSDGWQKSIQVDGEVKCLVCDELTRGPGLICSSCQQGIMAARTSINQAQLQAVSEFLENFPAQAFADAVGQDVMGKWLRKELEEMEGTN